MTERDLTKELNTALMVLKSSGMIERQALDFINAAVIEKLDRREQPEKPKTVVDQNEYLEQVADRAKRMSDEGLGHFVKATLWTATDKFKKGEGA